MHRVRKTLKKYFVPHEENGHHPQILRARSVAFVLAIALAMEGALWFGSTQLAPNSRLFGIIVSNVLVDETNQNRTTNALPALAESPLLDVAAQEKADDMVKNNYFAHTSPAGIPPWYWFEQVGYNFEYAGENLAVNFSDSEDVTNAWMNSPEHRANILNTNYTQIGMATATGTYEGHPAVYVVELFGTPVPPAPPAEAPLGLINDAAAAEKPVPAATSTATTTATSSVAIVSTAIAGAGATAAPPAPTAPSAPPAPQSNPIQRAAANPRQIVDDIYLAIIVLFALALGINIFVKIHIQHPQAIFAGMLVILVVGLLVVLNQHALVGTAIL
jgi:hypothetical protein